MATIYIYTEKPTSEDRSRLYKIFSFLNIQQEDIRIIDISIEDIDPVNNLLIFTIGRNSYAAVRRMFINAGVYSSKSLLGQGDIFEESLNFYWSYTPHSITEIFTNESVKEKVWASLCSLAGYYENIEKNKSQSKNSNEISINENESAINADKINTENQEDFDDDPEQILSSISNPIEDDLPWDPVSSEIVSETDKYAICESETVTNCAEVISEPKIGLENQTIEDVKDAPNQNVHKIKLSELADIISQNLDLSDATIGKSFSLLEKVELNTKYGRLIIYPTGERIKPPDKEATHLSLKDALSLIKMAAVFGANEVSFHQKDN